MGSPTVSLPLQIKWMLEGKVAAGSSLNHAWTGNNTEAGSSQMKPHVALILVKVSYLCYGSTLIEQPDNDYRCNNCHRRILAACDMLRFCTLLL